MSQVKVHPTALVSETAKLGNGVEVGAFSIIGPGVELGDGCKVHSHVVFDGIVKAGANNEFFSFCSIGAPPQDLTYKGEPTRVEIGDNNVFREYVSIHRGSTKEEGVTTIKNNCLLMAYTHIGHDVIMGNGCIIANSTNFAGHVRMGDKVIVGGGTQISQFTKIGRGAFIGGASAVDRDVPLFCTAYGNHAELRGINIIGLRRSGFSKEEISDVVEFYRTMEASGVGARTYIQNPENVSKYDANSIIREMCEGINNSKKGVSPFSRA